MRKKRSFGLFTLSLISLAGIIYFLFFTAPEAKFSILNFQFSNLVVFFLLLFLFLFSFFSCILRKFKHGLLIGTFGTSLLLLYLSKLAHIYFIFLLVALFILLEFLFRKEA